MTSHGLRCWDCQKHQRQLVSTEFNRPLFYTSVCLEGLDVRIEKCERFVVAELPPWPEPLIETN
jgi:hypothetical protein